MHLTRARRVGAAAVACALTLRLFAMGIPARFAAWLLRPETVPFLLYLETGRHVRFSPSSEEIVPAFAESPPAAAIEGPVPVLSDFSEAPDIPIYNPWGGEADLESLMARPLTWDLRGERPTVLILHTHSTESYAESPQWRTLDADFNMLSIGARVAEILEGEGIAVIQDRSLHDYPSYNGSYGDARKSIQAILKDNPDIRLVLDLHRDASEGKNGQMRTHADIGGKDSAQLMLVMGCNHETFDENLSLALKLHAQLEYQAPGIMRPMQLRTARYNQDLSPGALLVEVGAAGNTHQEAIAAAEQLAYAIAALARGTE